MSDDGATTANKWPSSGRGWTAPFGTAAKKKGRARGRGQLQGFAVQWVSRTAVVGAQRARGDSAPTNSRPVSRHTRGDIAEEHVAGAVFAQVGALGAVRHPLRRARISAGRPCNSAALPGGRSIRVSPWAVETAAPLGRLHHRTDHDLQGRARQAAGDFALITGADPAIAPPCGRREIRDGPPTHRGRGSP